MALNITTSNQEIKVETLNILVYGQPGTGKSSLAFTTKNPLTLDFDKGSHRSAFRKDIVQIKSWSDVAQITSEDLKNYDTIIVDTAGRAIDFLMQSIIAQGVKGTAYNGNLSQNGWGILKVQFANWVRQLNLIGKDIVFIAHDKEDKNGDQKFIRADVAGSSYSELMKIADFVGYYFMESNKRVIDFNPCEAFIGKNSAGFEKIFVPNFNQEPNYFANLIQQMKDTLNKRNSRQSEIANVITQYRNKILLLGNASEVNSFVAEIQTANLEQSVMSTIRGLLVQRTKELNLEYDKNSKMYFDPIVNNEIAKNEIFGTEETSPVVDGYEAGDY